MMHVVLVIDIRGEVDQPSLERLRAIFVSRSKVA
jgi:hypothetical protein